MKKNLTRSIYIVLLFLATSCLDDITSLNTNPKAYQSGTVPAGPFFSNATRELVDVLTDGFTFKVLAQQFAETTYFDASSYNLTNVGNAFWVILYRDVLRDLKEAKSIVIAKPSLFEDVDNNQLALIEILEVYSYSLLVTTYGNIPYAGAIDTNLKAEGLDSDNLTPAYDDAAAIYSDLFVRLDRAISMLKPDEKAFGVADLVYGDDLNLWI